MDGVQGYEAESGGKWVCRYIWKTDNYNLFLPWNIIVEVMRCHKMFSVSQQEYIKYWPISGPTLGPRKSWKNKIPSLLSEVCSLMWGGEGGWVYTQLNKPLWLWAIRKLSTLKGQPANLKDGNVGSFRYKNRKYHIS